MQCNQKQHSNDASCAPIVSRLRYCYANFWDDVLYKAFHFVLNR